jgi:RHS repeat-associated protein
MIDRGTDRPEPLKFTGHARDFTSGTSTLNDNQLDYMHARFYSAATGRFLSVDPGRDWDPYQPQSWNLYAYVRNNPINSTDPTGMKMDCVTKEDGSEDCTVIPDPEPAPGPELGLSDEMLRWLDERWYAVDDIRNPVTAMTLGEHATASANFAVGFGDASSLGLTAHAG